MKRVALNVLPLVAVFLLAFAISTTTSSCGSMRDSDSTPATTYEVTLYSNIGMAIERWKVTSYHHIRNSNGPFVGFTTQDGQWVEISGTIKITSLEENSDE